MGRVKELVTAAALKIEKEQSFVDFEEAMDRVCLGVHDIPYWIKFVQENKEIRHHIRIHCKDHDEEYEIAEKIHNVLVGNKDYIDCKIVLNMSADRRDGTENEVHVYIYKDSISNPDIMAKAFGSDWTKTFSVNNNYCFTRKENL